MRQQGSEREASCCGMRHDRLLPCYFLGEVSIIDWDAKSNKTLLWCISYLAICITAHCQIKSVNIGVTFTSWGLGLYAMKMAGDANVHIC